MTATKFACATALAVIAGIIIPAVASADTVGTIGVSLNISNACVVNGATAVQANSGVMGTIRFPDQPGIFGNIDAEMVGTGQSGALSVLCSPGATPALTIGSGANDQAGRRRVSANGTAIPYRLFSDSARTTEIGIGQQVSLPVATSSPTLVPIYARISSNGTVLPADAYTDTVQVTLTW